MSNRKPLGTAGIIRSFCAVILLAGLAAGGVQGVSAQDSAGKSAAWKAKMHAFRQTLQDLMFNLHVDTRFASSAGKKAVKKDTAKLVDLAHSLNPEKPGGAKAPDRDPMVKFVAGSLEADLKRAQAELKRGNYPYARGILVSVTQYCITCHTRSSQETAFSSLGAPAELKKLPAHEKADYFAAVREFDQALKEYESVIADAGFARRHPIEWDRAALKALSILVRVERDPERTEKLLKTVLATPSAPSFLKGDAKAWLETVEAWKKEPAREAMTESGHLLEGKRLMKLAQEKQRFPVDRAAEVLYLRASSELHDVLRTSKDPSETAEALYLIGICYESVKVPDLWTLHEFFYESCVRQVPHSTLARECYERYQASVFAGYSGSGGTHIPSDVAKHLRELDALSSPK